MWLLLAGAIIVIILLYLLSPILSPQKLELKGEHVMITGGSSGIGKAIALEAARQGANISLFARDKAKLDATKAEIELVIGNSSLPKIICISADVSGNYEDVLKAVKQAEEHLGPATMLVNCAGTSVSQTFQSLPVSEFKRMMDINYFGSVFVTKAALTAMLGADRGGRIVFISSQAGQLGLFGYSAYSASKFALRGLAESLQMEIKPYNIRVTLAFPPDTDTPGYALEQTDKPKETRLISETSGLFQPDTVAKKILNDVKHGKFFSDVGVDGMMLSILTCGMSPVISVMEAIHQVLLMGIFRCISLFYLEHFNKIVKKCKEERHAEQTKDKTN